MYTYNTQKKLIYIWQGSGPTQEKCVHYNGVPILVFKEKGVRYCELVNMQYSLPVLCTLYNIVNRAKIRCEMVDLNICMHAPTIKYLHACTHN